MSYSIPLIRFVKLCMMIASTIQTGMEDSYALKTDTLPTSSCLQRNAVQSTSRCLSICLRTWQSHYMLSYNILDQRCMCCENLTGSIVSDSGWMSYVIWIDTCPFGYTYYHSTNFSTCLKYVPREVTYPKAVASCAEEGGDLIRIDSQEKYTIFKNHLVQYAINKRIQVWIQGQEINGQWKFHDGTMIPEYCPLDESNDPDEVYMRSLSNLDFKCRDAGPTYNHHYMCEL